MRKRCAWCHERGGTLKQITVTVWDRFAFHQQEQTLAVHPAHEEQARAFAAHFRRYGRLFLGLLLGIPVAGVAASLLLQGRVAEDVLGPAVPLAVLGLLGLTLLLFPFCTGTTGGMMGLRTSRRVGRVLGALCILLGLFLAGLQLLV